MLLEITVLIVALRNYYPSLQKWEKGIPAWTFLRNVCMDVTETFVGLER